MRAGLVLVLLGLAAHGLSGRRGLDWSEISQPPGSVWVTLVLGALLVFAAVAAVRMVLRLLRHARGLDPEPGPEPDGWKMPLWGYALATVVLAITVLLVYQVLRLAAPPDAEFRDPGRIAPSASATPGEDDRAVGGLTLSGLLLIAAVVALLVVALLLRRRGRGAVVLPEEETDDDEATALAQAVAAAEQQLDSHGDDTREAIIAAYTAMEDQLRFVGTQRRASDTPTEFLQRAMAGSRISRGAATRLTDLFREARFSSHPMPADAREDAARALARVADDLAHARA